MKYEIYDHWDFSTGAKLIKTMYLHVMTDEEMQFIEDIFHWNNKPDNYQYRRFEIRQALLTPAEEILFGGKRER